MRLNRAVEPALRATLYLARAHGRRISVKELARASQTSAATLSPVLKRLAEKRLIHACAGGHGGYCFLWDPDAMALMRILEALDGPIFEGTCLLHTASDAREHWCPVHELWRQAQAAFIHTVGQQSLGSMLQRMTDWEAIEYLLHDLSIESPRSGHPSDA